MDAQSFADTTVHNVGKDISPIEETVVKRDPLDISLSDDKFILIAKKWIKDSTTFYEDKYNLKDRRKRNETYLWGRQLREKKLKVYASKYNDNIIWEGVEYLRAIALSRMPDIIVSPGVEQNEEGKQTAEKLSKVVDSDLKSEERRKALSMAFRHLMVYFVGAIKPFWNPEKGTDGDYDFKVVQPDNLILDHTSATNDPADMRYIAEYVEYSVKDLVMRFPDKEKELYDELRKTGVFTEVINETKESGMNSVIKIVEFHWTNYDKVGTAYQRTECVAWYYHELVLKKMKTPNWDWEGQPNLDITEDELRQAIINGEKPEQMNKVYYNYFDTPRKPYILLNYDQWGKCPLDETSLIEQAIPMQEEHDKRGKQFSEMLDRSRGKHIFSTESGLKKEDIEELDMTDPDVDLLVEGNVNQTHGYIQGEQPGASVFNDLMNSQNRVFAKMGTNGPSRGEQISDVATTNQLAREGDFTRADDLVEETINHAAREMAEWILQFIKLRYTVAHFAQYLGEDGKVVSESLHRDMVSDGMLVKITASGTDKLKAQQRAMDMAKLQMIDPLSFYKDLGVSDPIGRVEKLLMFQSDPAGYMAKFAMGLQNTQQQAAALATAPMPNGQPNPNVGPTTQNPQPGDTTQVNVTPPELVASQV